MLRHDFAQVNMFHVEQKTDKVAQSHTFLIDRLLWYTPARAPICLTRLLTSHLAPRTSLTSLAQAHTLFRQKT